MANMKYWSGEWPNLNNVSISLDEKSSGLCAADTGILYRLIAYIAANGVHSQLRVASSDPMVPSDVEKICRIANCTLSEWAAARDNIIEFFDETNEGLRLKDASVVRISKDAVRGSIPIAARIAALRRDGRACVYCGSTEGPFHFNHIWPVSRGGSDDASNIVVACAPCNLSKGGKTLREWRSI